MPTESFFNFFKPPQPPTPESLEQDDVDEDELAELDERLEADYAIGEDFKEKIIPRAVDYFTGKALRYEEDFEDEEDEEDFDEEDDFDEDDEVCPISSFIRGFLLGLEPRFPLPPPTKSRKLISCRQRSLTLTPVIHRTPRLPPPHPPKNASSSE